MLTTAAYSADMAPIPTVPRAVAEANGKFELGGGFGGMTGFNNNNPLYGAGSFTVPLGDRFGLQGDIAVSNSFGQTNIGGAGHFFTRDPNSYLLGVMGGYGSFGQVTGAWIGPEVELYSNQFSFEGVGGYLRVSPNGFAGYDKLYAIGNVGLYATNNLRFTVGAGTVADFKSAHFGLEYLLADQGLPVSLKLDGRIGDNNYYSATAGISFYFGGPSKDLIRRHREDDPPNGAVSLFNAGGVNLGFKPPAAGAPPLPACIYDAEFPFLSNNKPCAGPASNPN